MEVKIDVKFNIGDKVLVKKPHSGAFVKHEPFKAVINGYVIHKINKLTKVYYTLEIDHLHYGSCTDYNRKKKYTVGELELLGEH